MNFLHLRAISLPVDTLRLCLSTRTCH